MSVADAKGRRFDAATGIGFAVLTVVGVLLPGTPPKADDSSAKLVTFFTDHSDDLLVSSFVLGLAAVLFFWFAGSFRSYLRAAEGGEGRLSIAAFGGGVAGVTLLLAGAAILNGPAFKIAGSGADPNLVRVLFDAASAVLAMAGFPFAVFFAAASCSAARSGSLPPWAYWSGSVIAVLQILGGIALFAKSGAFATGGAFTLIAPLTGIIWVVAVAVVLMRRDGVPPVALTEP
ncbi:MAG: hypothetical protein QOK25_676 [Thermoleophilaceae bacterium]|nr:hypothetical protein [Thermoleophilaceae bacterium]